MKRFFSAAVGGAVIIANLAAPLAAAAAPAFSWNQTSWQTQMPAATATHPGDDSSWTYFAGQSNLALNPGATELRLDRATTYSVDSDFINGEPNGTTVVGSGPDASLVLAGGAGAISGEYETTGTLAPIPGKIGPDAKIIRDGLADQLYVLQGETGDSTNLFRYSFALSAWETLAVYGQGMNAGGDFIRAGTSDDFFLLRGGTYQDFVKYNKATNAWTLLPFLPEGAGEGGGLVHGGSEDAVYIVHGAGSTAFRKYNRAANTYTALAPVPGPVGDGGQVLRNGTDNFIYVLQGANPGGASHLYRYSISANAWTTLADVPTAMTLGSQAIRNAGDDQIFVLTGAFNGAFYRYNVAANTWTSRASLPSAGVPADTYLRGVALARLTAGDSIFASRGHGTSLFYKYSIADNAWTARTPAPGRIGVGATMVKAGDSVYVVHGDGTPLFSIHSEAANVWTGSKRSITELPSVAGPGASILRNGGDDQMYVLPGGSSRAFYRYSVAGNSWTTLAEAPLRVNESSLLRRGADDAIYALFPDNGTQGGLFRYSIASNSWTRLATPPAGTAEGGMMIRNGADDEIYVFSGTSLVRYNIGSNTWTSKPSITGAVGGGAGGQILRNGGDGVIYAVLGGFSKGLYRFNIAANTWTKLADSLDELGLGTRALRGAGEDNIYVVNGLGEFQRYSIVANAWTSLPDAPVVAYPVNDNTASPGYDVDALRKGGDIYALTRGNLLRFSIAGGAWETLPAVPGVTGYGNRFTAFGDDIHIVSGNTFLFNDPRSFWHFTLGTGDGYVSSGQYTSMVTDQNLVAKFGKITTTGTIPSGTSVHAAIRTGSTPTVDASWSPWGQAAPNGDIGNPPPPNRYLQYRLTLQTNDPALTPRINSVRIGSFSYLAEGGLTSSAFDTFDGNYGVSAVSWVEATPPPSGTSFTIFVRTAPTVPALATATEYQFKASTPGCVKSSWTTTCGASALPAQLKGGGDDRYVQYRVALTSDGKATPTIGSVRIEFSPAAAPNTVIDTKPAATTSSKTATFTFHSATAASYQCKYGSGAWTACTSPKSYTTTLGKHTFAVRGVDAVGTVDPTPATWVWTTVAP